jgi:chloride channel 3/4/5
MSGSSSQSYDQAQAEASSSRSSARQPTIEDGDSDNEDDLLAADPLNGGLGPGLVLPELMLPGPQGLADEKNHSLSFKRKTTHPSPFSLPRFLSGLQGSGSRTQSPADAANHSSHPLASRRRNGGGPSDSTDAILPYLDTATDAGAMLQDTKDATTSDWYVEGPGRRVGYDNLTAIDWIFEYAKERQRQRVLMSNTNGISGSIRQLIDASQIWLVLIATGIAAGCLAAFIDVASDWLADLKAGVCRNVDHGGKFYLSRTFCCWGMDGMI